MSPLQVPSALARLVLIIITTFAIVVSVTRTNPPPSVNNRKQLSSLENTLKGVIAPLIKYFSLATGIAEFVVVFISLAVPTEHDVIPGTCVKRISFSALALVGCLLSLCGMCIRVWCYRTLGRHFTFELSLLPGHKLITTGPYAIVRHPSYTGLFFALVGTIITNVTKGSWAFECGFLFPWLGIGWGMIFVVLMMIIVERCSREDKYLREAFREEWNVWSERVKWRMVPWCY